MFLSNHISAFHGFYRSTLELQSQQTTFYERILEYLYLCTPTDTFSTVQAAFLNMQACSLHPCQCSSTPISIIALSICCFHHPLLCAHACRAVGLIRPLLLTGVRRTAQPSQTGVRRRWKVLWGLRCSLLHAALMVAALMLWFEHKVSFCFFADSSSFSSCRVIRCVFTVLFNPSMHFQIHYVLFSFFKKSLSGSGMMKKETCLLEGHSEGTHVDIRSYSACVQVTAAAQDDTWREGKDVCQTARQVLLCEMGSFFQPKYFDSNSNIYRMYKKKKEMWFRIGGGWDFLPLCIWFSCFRHFALLFWNQTCNRTEK